MFIEKCTCPPIATNSYLLFSSKGPDALLIDPGCQSLSLFAPLLSKHKLTLAAILLTHSHWDHIVEAADWQTRYHAPLYVHTLDAPNLVTPGADQLPSPLSFSGSSSWQPLHDGQPLTFGSHHLTVIHTPGHSIGSVCFYYPDEKLLFTGDTLFRGTIGNLSFPTSAPEQMRSSLKKLTALPPDTQVLPGHGDATTLAAESSWLR